jgi:hypothetical protein
MASNKINLSYNWGDPVRINSNAPEKYKPNSIGSICGFRVIESNDVSTLFNNPIGSELCLVEFTDGTSIEIPSIFLSRLD